MREKERDKSMRNRKRRNIRKGFLDLFSYFPYCLLCNSIIFIFVVYQSCAWDCRLVGSNHHSSFLQYVYLYIFVDYFDERYLNWMNSGSFRLQALFVIQLIKCGAKVHFGRWLCGIGEVGGQMVSRWLKERRWWSTISNLLLWTTTSDHT